MLIVNIICVMIGCVCAAISLAGFIIVATDKSDWRDLALALFFSLIAAICFYAAYMGGAA